MSTIHINSRVDLKPYPIINKNIVVDNGSAVKELKRINNRMKLLNKEDFGEIVKRIEKKEQIDEKYFPTTPQNIAKMDKELASKNLIGQTREEKKKEQDELLKKYNQDQEIEKADNDVIVQILKNKLDDRDIQTVLYLKDIGLGRFVTEDIEDLRGSGQPKLSSLYRKAGYVNPVASSLPNPRSSDRSTYKKLNEEYIQVLRNLAYNPITNDDNLRIDPLIRTEFVEPVVVQLVPTEGEEGEEESTPAQPTTTLTLEVPSVVNTDTTAIATGNYDNTIQVSDTERILQERIFRIRDDILSEERAIPRNQERIDQLTSLMNDVEAEVLNLEKQSRNLQGAETGQLIDAGYDVPGVTGNITTTTDSSGNVITTDDFGNIVPEIGNIDLSGSSDPDDMSGGSKDPDPGSSTTINMNEEIVESPALNNTAILPTSPYKPKYHIDAIKFMYGNADTPNWDPSITLAVQKLDLKKEIINLYIDTLIETYGKKMLIFKRKSDGDLVELNEVMQLQYSIERGMQIGPRARQAVVSVADLVRFDNTLRADPAVPQPPPSNEITPLNEVNNRLAQTTNAASASAQRGRNVYESDTYNQRFERIITNPYGIRTDIRLMPIGPAYDAFDI